MDLKSIVLPIGAAFGYVGTGEDIKTTTGERRTDLADIGRKITYQRYTFRPLGGDTLESIAAQIVERGISGFEKSSYTPEKVYEAVLKQLQRHYPVDPKAVLSTRTTLQYNQFLHFSGPSNCYI